MKHWLKVVFVIVLIVFILVACASLDEGESAQEIVVVGGETAVPPTSLPNTPTPIPTFTLTRTPVPTDVPLPTSFSTAIWTSEPSYMATTIPDIQPEPTPQVIWQDKVGVVTNVDSDFVVWSPVSNEFVLDICSENEGYDQLLGRFAFIASEPDFIPINITPLEIVCSMYTYFEWRPDGQQILFNGLPISSPLLESNIDDSTSLYIMDRNGTNFRRVNTAGWLFEIYGWMDNDRLVKRSYRGGGNWIVSIFDVKSDVELSWAWIYAHSISGLNYDYVVTNSGDPGVYMSATVFSEIKIRPEEIPTPVFSQRSGSGPYLKYLSFDNNEIKGEPLESFFNSRFEDWISESNQILVLTWDAHQRLFEFDILHDQSGPTDLKMWDVETNELTLVVPGGIYGRISPDRHYLVFLTPSSEFPNLQLLDRISGESVFVQSVFAEVDQYTTAVSAYTSFSPNGRFLTFFNPTHELIIYDLENEKFLAPLTAVPSEPLWSPDGSRFVYENPDTGLSIFDTRSATPYPLAVSGSDRLLETQWSYDGTYLSVTVKQEEWWARETAVLQIP